MAPVKMAAAVAAAARRTAKGGKATLPPAFEVFPTLRRFVALDPRHSKDMPIGNEQPVTTNGRSTSLRHIYHDLGVLVFAGCNARQVTQIGDILEGLVRAGGPSRMFAAGLVDTRLMAHRRLEAPFKTDFTTPLSAERNVGRLHSGALLRMANDQLRAMAVHGTAQGVLAAHVYREQKQANIRVAPKANGVIYEAVSGDRHLPLDLYYSVEVVERSRLSATFVFYTAGTGRYVGRVEITALPSNNDRVQDAVQQLLSIKKNTANWSASSSLAPPDYHRTVTEQVKGLWELERAIWSERADEIEKEEKVLGKNDARNTNAGRVKRYRPALDPASGTPKSIGEVEREKKQRKL